MIRILLVSVSVMLVSCATWKPTLYTPKDQSGYGYKIEPHPTVKGFHVATFEGNADTAPFAATTYSYIAASEYCHNQGQIAVVSLPADYSEYTSYTQLRSYQVNKQTHYYSTPITKRHPKYAASFGCFENARTLTDVEATRNLSAEALGNLSPDFRGGILVEGLKVGSKTKLQKDDVILSINGERIEDYLQISFILSKNKSLSQTTKVLRNKKPMTVKAEVFDNSKVVSAFNRGMVDRLCAKLKDSERPAYCQVNAAAMK